MDKSSTLPYAQFENDQSTENTSRSSRSSSSPPVRLRGSKSEKYKFTKKLIFFELIMSCVILACGITSTSLSNDVPVEIYNPVPKIHSANILVPILGIISAVLGIFVLRYWHLYKNGLLITNFIFRLISSVALGSVLIASACIRIIPAIRVSYWENFHSDDDNVMEEEMDPESNDRNKNVLGGVFVLEVTIAVLATTSMMFNFMTTCFVYRHRLRGRNHDRMMKRIRLPPIRSNEISNNLATVSATNLEIILTPSNNETGFQENQHHTASPTGP